MRLEAIEIALRPRHPWEAADLGAGLLRAHAKELATIWLLVAGPIFLIPAMSLMHSPGLGLLLIWWLRPLADRPLLEYLSRAIFGDRSSPTEILGRWPRLLLSFGLGDLSWRRLDPHRCFFLALTQLEMSEWKARAQRRQVLAKPGLDVAFTCSLVFQGLEIVFLASSCGLLFWLFGSRFGNEIAFQLLNVPSEGLPPRLYQILCALWFLSSGVVESLAVATGFALYLDRRTLLEAWDLDVELKRARSRLQRIGTIAALLACFAAPTLAQQTLEQDPDPQAVVVEVLADEVFGNQREVETCRLREGSWLERFLSDIDLEEDEDTGSWFIFEAILGVLAETLIWIFAAVILIWLAMQLKLAWQRRSKSPHASETQLPALIDHGQLGSEDLPNDPVKAARQALAEGRALEALSLLYRSLIYRASAQLDEPVPASATEGEVRRLLGKRLAEEPRGLLDELTRQWLLAAYAHRPLDPLIVDSLAGRYERWTSRLEQ